MNHLSNANLLKQLKALLSSERHTLADFLRHLGEVDRRRLHAQEAYSSLHKYCTQALGLSGDAAYKRITVARLARRFPVMLSLLTKGEIHMTAIAMISSILTEENHQEALSACCRKTKYEVEQVKVRYAPQPDVSDLVRRLPSKNPTRSGASADSGTLPLDAETPVEDQAPVRMAEPLMTPARRDRVAPLSEERVKIQFTGSEELRGKLERAKAVLRHKYPQGRLEDIFDEALEVLLEKRDPERKVARQKNRKAQIQTQKETRRIPERVKHEVWKRDQGRCQYVSPTGKPCGECSGVEFDHVQPWTLGGSSTDPQNIRLLCQTHNRMLARQMLGDELVDHYIQSKKNRDIHRPCPSLK